MKKNTVYVVWADTEDDTRILGIYQDVEQARARAVKFGEDYEENPEWQQYDGVLQYRPAGLGGPVFVNIEEWPLL